MNEAETRAEYIYPALAAAGWGVMEGSHCRREFPLTPGRIDGFARLDILAAIYRQKLAAPEALKKSLLHQAFSGQL